MSKYIQYGNYEATELDGEWIILNIDRLTITKLNDIGGYCWNLLKEVQSSKSLAQSVVKEFSTDETEVQIKKDIEQFLESLLHCGLVKPC